MPPGALDITIETDGGKLVITRTGDHTAESDDGAIWTERIYRHGVLWTSDGGRQGITRESLDVPDANLMLESRFDPDVNVWVTPDGRTWQYVDPNIAHGSETRVRSAGPAVEADRVTVPRFIWGQEHRPFAECMTREQARRDADRLAYD